MIQKIFKSLTIVFTFVIVFSIVAFAGTISTNKKQVDGLNVSLVFDQNPIKTGNNNFKIIVMDSKDQPISGAQITTTFDMNKSTMGTMEILKPIAVTLKENNSGEYTGAIDLSNKGDWMVKTEFKIEGQDKNTEFEINVVNSGPNWLIIGGFLGFIVLVIIIAFVIKKKNTLRA